MAQTKPVLKFNNAKNNSAVYKKNIADLNQRLVWWGLLDESHNNDIFSTHTLEAVQDFQSKRDLEVDGVVGRNTWYELTKPSDGKLSDEDKVTIISQQEETSEDIIEDISLGIQCIKNFEGLRLAVYPDPGTGGKPYTVGYGSTRTLNGKPWVLGQKITKQDAEELLMREMSEKFLPKLRQIPYWDEMNSNQQSALTSFAWNVGAHFYGADGFETISRVLKNKEWNSVPKALMLYVNPGSSVEKGLKNRRQAEGQLWSRK